MRIAAGASGLVCLSALAVAVGCGGGSSSTGGGGNTNPPPPPNFELSGKVMGGQQPVSGAEVQLYVAGSTGYGSGATLLTPAVFTDQSGAFILQGNLTCPSSGALTYVTATGGHTGSGSDNPEIGMMAALGSCGSLNNSTAVINEMTTVASVWGLTPFLGAGGALGTSSPNAKGLANAFANVSSLVDVATGVAPGRTAPANATLPTAKIDTLANILSACVQQSSASACGTLFTAATPAGGSAPGNTLDAALNIARNPAANPASLFGLVGSSAPFQPSLAAAPPDWTLAITLAGGGLNTPGAIALDASGNVWVANYFSAVSEFSSSGAAISPAGGFAGGGLNESYGLAVNQDGSVWVTDEQSPGVNGGNGTVTVLTASGQPSSGAAGYSGGGVFFPLAAAADSNGNVWVADYGDSAATEFTMAGTAVSPSTGFGTSQLEGPAAVAIDAKNNAWFANQSAQTGSVTSVSSDGSKVNSFVCGGDAPSGIAIDAIADAANAATGHIWTANYFSDSVSELALHSDGSAALVGTAYTGGGIRHPNSLAVDGAGNVWVANYRGGSVSELQGAKAAQPGAALSPAAGYGSDASLAAPYAIAIDASGNVWVSNQGQNATKQFTITEFLGAATPVRTPLLGPAQIP